MTAKEAKELALSSQASVELRQHIEFKIKTAALLGKFDAVAWEVDAAIDKAVVAHFRELGYNVERVLRDDAKVDIYISWAYA